MLVVKYKNDLRQWRKHVAALVIQIWSYGSNQGVFQEMDYIFGQ